MGPHALAGIFAERPPGKVMHGERTECLDERAHAGKGIQGSRHGGYFSKSVAAITLQNVQPMSRSYSGD